MIYNNNNIVNDAGTLIREKSVDVKLPLSDEDKEILMSLYKYVLDSTDEELAEKENLSPAVGIAAIQVGINKKMIAVVLRGENEEVVHQYALANPKIVSESVEEAYLAGGEGCLSVPEMHEGYVYRHRRVKVRGYDLLTDRNIEIKASDYLAIVLQHEIDHFNGILYYDRINKKHPFIEKEGAHRIG